VIRRVINVIQERRRDLSSYARRL